MQVETFSVALLVNQKLIMLQEKKGIKQTSMRPGKSGSFSITLPIENYSAQNLPGSTLNGFICMQLTR